MSKCTYAYKDGQTVIVPSPLINVVGVVQSPNSHIARLIIKAISQCPDYMPNIYDTRLFVTVCHLLLALYVWPVCD